MSETNHEKTAKRMLAGWEQNCSPNLDVEAKRGLIAYIAAALAKTEVKGAQQVLEGSNRRIGEYRATIKHQDAEIARLKAEVEKLNKCSYQDPMRDCPTHGETEELKSLRTKLAEVEREVNSVLKIFMHL